MPVPMAGADLARGGRLVPVEADEACPQVRVLALNRESAGRRTLSASFDRADHDDCRNRRNGQHRHREEAAFPRSLVMALPIRSALDEISVTARAPCSTDR